MFHLINESPGGLIKMKLQETYMKQGNLFFLADPVKLKSFKSSKWTKNLNFYYFNTKLETGELHTKKQQHTHLETQWKELQKQS